MVTVKEYAESRGKSVQAVYKQIKSKQNVELLKGHIAKQVVSGKEISFLDDSAVQTLDEASKQAPTIIIQDAKDDRILELEKQVREKDAQISLLKDEIIRIQGESNRQIVDLSNRVLVLTMVDQEPEPEPEPEPKKWWQFWR